MSIVSGLSYPLGNVTTQLFGHFIKHTTTRDAEKIHSRMTAQVEIVDHFSILSQLAAKANPFWPTKGATTTSVKIGNHKRKACSKHVPSISISDFNLAFRIFDKIVNQAAVPVALPYFSRADGVVEIGHDAIHFDYRSRFSSHLPIPSTS